MKIGRLVFGSTLLILVACIVFLQPGDSMAALRENLRSPNTGQQQVSAEPVGEVIVSDPVYPVLTAAARDLPPVVIEPTLDREINPRMDHSGQTASTVDVPGNRDPLLDIQLNAPPPSASGFDTPIFNFNGQGYTFLNPPDTVGDIGTNHYVQMINATLVAVYDKTTGNMINQFSLTALGGCTTGAGDPIVLYDHMADRWLLSEFGPGNSLCVLISQTPDPSGAYYSYKFNTPSFPDYPKYGVWTDAYYATTNESSPAAYALDRTNMLAGNVATSQRFTAPGLPGFGFEAMTPADWDGATPPPAGAPGIFMRHRDTEAHGNCADTGAQDCLELFAFDVDWSNPGNSTFTKLPDVAMTEFDSNICGLTAFSGIPMPGVAKCAFNSLDPLREVIMFRLAYRNFGDHETMVGNLVTDASGNNDAGVRWFELRKSGASNWSVHQEGTYAPDSNGRWMGSIAMDGDGNIALGYNVSGSATFPSLRYAGRLAGDPLGTLPQGEYVIVNGSGVNGSSRYGDYAAMSIDPIDDCTFWFTGEYNATSQWSTRIAAFRFDECGGGGTDTVISRKIKSIYNHPNFPGLYLAKVQAVDPVAMTPVAGAVVDVTLTLPDGTTMPSAVANGNGWAKYQQATAGGGNCTITVDNITAPGYTFDPFQGVTTQTISCSVLESQLEWTETP
ncbi:MAG: hypothetical protein M9928_12085 [Anaerolineae bacterium]|nr:hypothetical protein [Anaerolineae bacterium]MCO5205767.1 hypothetical protein [Anaerolineae bacterium]